MAYPVPPNLPPEVARFYNPSVVQLPSGLTSIPYPNSYTYNSPVVTGGVGGFKVNVSGLYQIDALLPVDANGATWGPFLEKELYVQVTRGVNTAIVLGSSSDEDSGSPYVLNMNGIVPLYLNDVVQIYHSGTTTGGPTDPQTLLASPPYEGVWVQFTFVKSI